MKNGILITDNLLSFCRAFRTSSDMNISAKRKALYRFGGKNLGGAQLQFWESQRLNPLVSGK